MPYYLTKVERCERCNGSGYVQHPPDEEETCPECEGQGSIRTEARFEDALREWLPWALNEIEERERALIEAADADALAAEWETSQ